MPNYSYNQLTITGKAGELKRFLTEGLYGYQPVYTPTSKFEEEQATKRPAPVLTRTMNKLLPVPQDVLEKGYSDAGFDWQCENWGTKWDFCDMYDNRMEEDIKSANDNEIKSLTYRYSTAWSPNEPWVKEASKQFPALMFDFNYEEESGSFAGRIVYQATREIVRHDYTDMVLYHIVEEKREIKEIIEDRYFIHQEVSFEDFLSCILDDFGDALVLAIITEEEVTYATKEVWTELSDEEEVA